MGRPREFEASTAVLDDVAAVMVRCLDQ